MTRRIATHWTNRQPIGSPPKFEVTGWREPERKEEKPKHQAELDL